MNSTAPPGQSAKTKPCAKCASTISEEAEICPHCRSKQGMGFFAKMFLWGFAFVVFAGVFSANQDPAPPKTPEQIAANKRAYEMRIMITEAEHQIKALTKNPASFKVTDSGIAPNGVICIKYRGTNSFGGVVPGVAYVIKNTYGSDAAGFLRHCSKNVVSKQQLY